MKDTELAQIALTHDHTGAIANPIYLSTAYQHPSLGQSTGYDYTRTKNPTRSAFEESFAKLERGSASFATSSGMAAIQLICNLFKPNDEILVSFDLYGGTFRLFDFYEQQYGIKFKYVDFLNYEEVTNQITANTKALFIEPISNPQMIAINVEPYYQLAQKHHLLTIIDNTFLTPYLSTPLEEGADIVLHSATKYIGGHNDVLAGVVTVKDDKLAQQLFDFHNMIGATLSPLDSYLLQRGLKTLHLRIERSQSNAQQLAAKCQELEAIDQVLYSGRTGMLSLRLNRDYNVAKFLENLEICIFAESLGGTETLITFPYTQTHVDMPDIEKDKRGIDEYLIRLSIGIEDYKDIERDIIQALKHSYVGGII
ncbi:aminotransferase class I/II-fold pyridoxal phosphate-dependent enzyme [Staphylococcus simiae]|uniref:PLP-dependent transferase n=1 Tax=Staphylococcus simiae TaxID=308354 RepID=UPI001A9575C8|nr:PLP-dependent transferase [Staphylococcus simiae]MBO1199761.1 aminotransferase class I/II-fold pyridoxal phosphate-dependent enzyme [Staphylococcus simiae]MBO1202055.1 aminotransferase class I/II-fold pyridoxal phosphate-dependent enzyme [Staphylococcus simiae]MBO1204297.1 aminotransferase class I/II-fold pyridoxal phosphate-dependent enzyme [Staphylococcus simiae]MBO1211862.1 aminotransferase class I/II-fold pyridoxal phosphate-dependent enzyme [Staphylococcus simiae]MBO1230477.1 aminotran